MRKLLLAAVAAVSLAGSADAVQSLTIQYQVVGTITNADVYGLPYPTYVNFLRTYTIDIAKTQALAEPTFDQSGTFYRISENSFTVSEYLSLQHTRYDELVISFPEIDFTSTDPTVFINDVSGKYTAVAFYSRGNYGLIPLSVTNLRITTSNDNFDEAITYSTISPAPLPESSSWAMMIAGFVLIGAARRRRRALA